MEDVFPGPRWTLSGTAYKLRRFFRNVAFRLGRTHVPRRDVQPPLRMLTVLALVSGLFLLSGGVTVILSVAQGNLGGLLDRSQGLLFVIPRDLNSQTPQEGIEIFIIYGLGLIGLYLLLSSTRQAYSNRSAWRQFFFGAVLTIASFALALAVMTDKGFPLF